MSRASPLSGRRAGASCAFPQFLTALALVGAVLPSAPVEAQTAPWQSPPAMRRIAAAERPSARVSQWAPVESAPSSRRPLVTPASEATSVYADGAPVSQPQADAHIVDGSAPVFEGAGESCGAGDLSCETESVQGCSCCLPGCRRFWFSGEYLLWWTAGNHVPALVTSSPVGTAAAVSGVLGQPATSILFGNSDLGVGARSGARFTLGYWLTPCQDFGIEANYLFLGSQGESFQASSATTPILARPYFHTVLGVQAAQLVAHPTFLTGSIGVSDTTDFQAVEVLLRHRMFRGACDRLDFLVGWRFARLDDDLSISQTSQFTAPPVFAGITQVISDQFNTNNEFNGVDLGLLYQDRLGCWSLDVAAKVALGNTRSLIVLDGGTTTTVPPGVVANTLGGLYAQSTNIGRYQVNNFTAIPEVGATLGYHLTCCLRLTFGYNLLYWSKVARAGGQIDVGASQLPPAAPPAGVPPRPAVLLQTTDFWAQGMNFGLEYKF